ncbi:uncharacterized protein [Argopecten irradians]|uniref:uncharacterized protein n=1 Tax=Argopecten irradians TaxID=31199 RepID=UPI00371E90FC
MSAMSSVYNILTLCSAISLFTVVTSCNCPEDDCMKIPDTRRRCECCVFVFLGKRSGGTALSSGGTPIPSGATLSEFNRERSDNNFENQRSVQSMARLYRLLMELARSTPNNENRGNVSPHYNRRNVFPRMVHIYDPSVFGIDWADQSNQLEKFT